MFDVRILVFTTSKILSIKFECKKHLGCLFSQGCGVGRFIGKKNFIPEEHVFIAFLIIITQKLHIIC